MVQELPEQHWNTRATIGGALQTHFPIVGGNNTPDFDQDINLGNPTQQKHALAIVLFWEAGRKSSLYTQKDVGPYRPICPRTEQTVKKGCW